MRIRTPLFAALLALTAPAALAQDPAGEPADPPAPDGVEAAAPGREQPDPSGKEGSGRRRSTRSSSG